MIPFENWMTIIPRLLKLGLSPFASDHHLRIVKQKIREEPPLSRVVESVAYGDEPAVVQLRRDYGLAFTLLLNAKQVTGLVSTYSVLNLTWIDRPA